MECHTFSGCTPPITWVEMTGAGILVTFMNFGFLDTLLCVTFTIIYNEVIAEVTARSHHISTTYVCLARTFMQLALLLYQMKIWFYLGPPQVNPPRELLCRFPLTGK